MPRVRIYPSRPESFEGPGAEQPTTPIEALMQAPPGFEPEVSVMERWPVLDLVNEAIEDLLDDREKWVIQALFWRRMTLRELGRELSLSKTQVARIRDSAMNKMRGVLSGHEDLL